MAEPADNNRPAAWKGRAALGALRLCACLPLSRAQALGRFLGAVMWRFARRTRLFAECNLALCLPELSETEREALARESLAHLGMAFTEAGALWLWPQERLARIPCSTVNEELLDAALAAGRGVLIALPHLGAWEFLNPYLIARGVPFMAMYRPARLPELDGLMRGARERMGATLVPANAGGVKALMRHLAQGGLSVILPDQEPEASGGVYAPFFGLSALTATLYSRLLAKTGAAPLFAYVERRAGAAGYRVHFHAAPAGLADADPVVAAAALNRGVEECVRALPAQYQWTYKRFSTRPAGQQRPYALFAQDRPSALAAMHHNKNS